jgi:hypothetical protein
VKKHEDDPGGLHLPFTTYRAEVIFIVQRRNSEKDFSFFVLS